jgi:hypothetical protein
VRSGRFWLDEVVDLNFLLGWAVVRRSERPGARWSPTSERERERKRASLTIREEKWLEPNSFSDHDASRESRAYDSAFNPLLAT